VLKVALHRLPLAIAVDEEAPAVPPAADGNAPSRITAH
jgi:hypothetical protein